MKATGIDVGEINDPSAIADVDHEGPRFIVRRAETLPTMGGYEAQGMYMATRIAGRDVGLIDITGVGLAFQQMALSNLPNLITIWLTGGKGWKVVGKNRINLGKDVLIEHLATQMEKGNISLQCPREQADQFSDQLRSFASIFTPQGKRKTGARYGAHDDLVIAVALGVFAPRAMEILRGG